MFQFLLRFLKLRKRPWRKIFWTSLVLVIVYLEAAVYFLQAVRWPSATCGSEPSIYHKVLLVADPQILGEVTESWIARWDSDRFLSKTFKLAVEHVKPSLVIFLGDLMDEGSTASDEEYARYYRRFTKIFRIGSPLVPNDQIIYLPGDNDIGGENEEVTPKKLNRFDKYFGLKPITIRFHNARFSKVNFMLKRSPKPSPLESDKNISIVLSHMPLLGASTFFTERVVKELKPNVIISAHDHKAVHFVGNLETGERTLIESMLAFRNSYIVLDHSWKWRFQSSRVHTNEILVPTCSYRMGVRDTGYGVLLIDDEGDNVCYSILWLPDRLYHLKMHFYILLFLGVYSLSYLVTLPRLFRKL